MSLKMPKVVGRPTLYKEEYCQQMIDYFKEAKLTETRKEIVASGGKAVEIEKTGCATIPSFAGFAMKMDICRDTLRDWCSRSNKFLLAYKRCKEIQEAWLMDNGLRGNVNTAFGIFTAKNVLQWRDKVEQIYSFEDIGFEDENDNEGDNNE